jgi:hypothetical protein
MIRCAWAQNIGRYYDVTAPYFYVFEGVAGI